jgi:hypothetical protein
MFQFTKTTFLLNSFVVKLNTEEKVSVPLVIFQYKFIMFKCHTVTNENYY